MKFPDALACLARGVLFFFNDTATTEIYTLSLHDALPISREQPAHQRPAPARRPAGGRVGPTLLARSEEHTSELQSQPNLVCRLLLEKKDNQTQGGHSVRGGAAANHLCHGDRHTHRDDQEN